MRLETTPLWRLALVTSLPWLVVLAIACVFDYFGNRHWTAADAAFVALPFAFVLTLSVVSHAIEEMRYLDLSPDTIKVGRRFRKAEDVYLLQCLRKWGYERVEPKGIKVFGSFKLVPVPGRWSTPSQDPPVLILEFDGSRLLKIKPWLFRKDQWPGLIDALRERLPEQEVEETGSG